MYTITKFQTCFYKAKKYTQIKKNIEQFQKFSSGYGFRIMKYKS